MSLGTNYLNLVKIQLQQQKHPTTCPWPLGESFNKNETSAC